MTTLINTLMNSIQTQLQNTVTPVNGRVFRHRMINLTREDLPAINLIIEKEQPIYNGQCIARREITLKVQVHTRGDSCETDALDIMQLVLLNLLKTQFDPLIDLISEREGDFEHADADSPACAYSKSFKVFAQTELQAL